MPRASNGTYTLPAGNPVVSGTTITSSWANTTLSDLASALTDSLSRSGSGGMTAPLSLAAGTAAAPALTFTLDPDIGIYRYAANQLGFSTGGTYRGSFGDTFFDLAVPIYAVDGNAGAPAFAFTAANNSGLYRNSGNNEIRISYGGVDVAGFSSAVVSSYVQHQLTDGNAGAPAIAFRNDPDTGFYRVTSDVIGLTTGGALRFNFGSFGVRGPDGSAAVPAYSFDGDTDTGFYRDTSNQIGISLGGITAGLITQGSFTGTLTGMTGSTTGTVHYQRIGNRVTLWVASSITGTSNDSIMTMTGLPAVIQSTGSLVPSVSLIDSGTQCAGLVSAANTLSFFLYEDDALSTRILASGAGFTSSGTKGLSAGWTITYIIY